MSEDWLYPEELKHQHLEKLFADASKQVDKVKKSPAYRAETVMGYCASEIRRVIEKREMTLDEVSVESGVPRHQLREILDSSVFNISFAEFVNLLLALDQNLYIIAKIYTS